MEGVMRRWVELKDSRVRAVTSEMRSRKTKPRRRAMRVRGVAVSISCELESQAGSNQSFGREMTLLGTGRWVRARRECQWT